MPEAQDIQVVQDIPVDLHSARGLGVNLDAYFNTLWAVEPTRVQGVLDYLTRMNVPLHIQAQQVQQPTARQHMQVVGPRNAAGYPGGDSGGGGVAVISVDGTMMKHWSSLMQVAETPLIRKALRRAAQDPDIVAGVLRFDSPGGTVAGTDEFGQEVLRFRQIKPLLAYVEDLTASAAYWVASQTDGIYANSATALIGSIGTYIGLYDTSKMAEMKGVRVVVIKTSELKGTGFPGSQLTAEQESYLQDIVDKTQAEFDKAVGKGRGLNKAQVEAVRTGRVYMAKDAQALKLIDGIDSLDGVVNRAMKMARQRRKGGTQASVSSVPRASLPIAADTVADPRVAATIHELKASMPNAPADFIIAQLESKATLQQAEAAYGDHLQAENERLKALLKKPGLIEALGTQLSAVKRLADQVGVDVGGVEALVSDLMQSKGLQRHEAFREVMKGNEELRVSMVIEHNLRHGRKRAAQAFADQY